MNRNTKIGLGVLAVIGIGYYLWKKNQEKNEKKSNIWGNNYYGDNKGKWRGRKRVSANA